MPGVTTLTASMQQGAPYGTIGPVVMTHSLAALEWQGPLTVNVPTGTVEQSVIFLGILGLSEITALLIHSDVDISVTYGVVGTNTPVDLDAGGFHCMAGTNVTALAISNSAGVTAAVTLFCAGQ